MNFLAYPSSLFYISSFVSFYFSFRCRSITFSPDWKKFAVWSSDRKLRLFRMSTGKLIKVYDESFTTVTELQQTKQLVPNIEFGRRMAMERDLEKVEVTSSWGNALFDETGNFLIYPTPLGVKVVNLVTNNCVRWIGKPENIRFLCLGLFQVRLETSFRVLFLLTPERISIEPSISGKLFLFYSCDCNPLIQFSVVISRENPQQLSIPEEEAAAPQVAAC